jgi:hypothetical protein
MEQAILLHPRSKTTSLTPLSFFAHTPAIAGRIFVFGLIGLPPI